MERYIPEQQLQPELVSCRQFDSRSQNLVQGHRTRERTAQSYEFSIYLSDGGSLILPDGEHAIHRGFCRFIPPGMKLSSIPHYRSYTVYFTLSGEENGQFPHCRNPFLDSLPLCYESRMVDSYLSLLQDLEQTAFSTDVGAALQRRLLLLKLLLLIHKDTATSQERSATDRAVDIAKQYLEQHIARDIPLDTLGEVTGYHPLYLQRIFKQATGCTPHAYLTGLRLQKAKEALVLTAQPISQIAHECGYCSVSHFTNLFRKQVGQSPLTFRKRSKILP